MLHSKAPKHRMRREFFRVHATHLGDIIVSNNLIYNMSLQGRFISVVDYDKDSAYKDLFRVFDYEGLIIHRMHGMARLNPIGYNRILNTNNSFWCSRHHISGTPRCFLIKNFRLPKNRVTINREIKPYQVCQFDSHSAFEKKTSYSRREIDSAVKRFNMGNAHHVGRKGTVAYTSGLPTYYSNLAGLASFVAGSQSFFGIDSGISHLAGSLGIHGDVCIQTQHEGFVSCVVMMYRFMYPRMRLHRRRLFQ